MKTVKEWAKELPQPYRRQLLRNINKKFFNEKEVLLSDVILCYFSWQSSPEGFEYWNDVFELVRGIERHEISFRYSILHK